MNGLVNQGAACDTSVLHQVEEVGGIVGVLEAQGLKPPVVNLRGHPGVRVEYLEHPAALTHVELSHTNPRCGRVSDGPRIGEDAQASRFSRLSHRESSLLLEAMRNLKDSRMRTMRSIVIPKATPEQFALPSIANLITELEQAQQEPATG